MGYLLAYRLGEMRSRLPRWRAPLELFSLLIALAFIVAGCHSIPPVDTKPLDTAGMSYDAIKELAALNISTAEVAQVAKARESGLSDADCIDVMKIYRGRNQPFDAGDAIAGLIGADVSESTIIQLATINQLGLGSGELE